MGPALKTRHRAENLILYEVRILRLTPITQLAKTTVLLRATEGSTVLTEQHLPRERLTNIKVDMVILRLVVFRMLTLGHIPNIHIEVMLPIRTEKTAVRLKRERHKTVELLLVA